MSDLLTTIAKACGCGGRMPPPIASVPTKDRAPPEHYAPRTETIGSKRAFTPEGYLICYDVPIARLGKMDYLGIELPGLEDLDGVIEVDQYEDVLFSEQTMRSYDLKPVTVEHPPMLLDASTWNVYSKGTVTNVRRGEGDQDELLLADLIVMDKHAISQVQAGLVEVSAGYDAGYEQISPGRVARVSNIGNHVALVKSARCGPVCSIGDSASTTPHSGETQMAATAVKKPTKVSALFDSLRKSFMTRDSDAFEQAILEVIAEDPNGPLQTPNGDIHIHVNGTGPAVAPEANMTKDDEPGAAAAAAPADAVLAAIQAVSDKVDAISARVTALEADPDADPVDDQTNDADPDTKPAKPGTNDSAAFRNEFIDALSRAEILAPGVKFPTFDAKAAVKKTTDSLCVLRRRALIAAADGANADVVATVTSGADLTKTVCGELKSFFIAASEIVKHRNLAVPRMATADSKPSQEKSWENINDINAAYWASKK